MNYTNTHLTEKGQKIFEILVRKWLKYNDKNDDNSEKRRNNIKMLDKYYQQLLDKYTITNA